eukprot:TRINITY_DN14703_c0_g1_i1.p1 TRINITY_DN14703_c0_g1~~TRINITY_DN14703_c0_g1_i1.p1  ORF type:complete len:337 (+),score=23.80 TRINITY_DN14703_c0_g1_i1:130-1011(+)
MANITDPIGVMGGFICSYWKLIHIFISLMTVLNNVDLRSRYNHQEIMRYIKSGLISQRKSGKSESIPIIVISGVEDLGQNATEGEHKQLMIHFRHDFFRFAQEIALKRGLAHVIFIGNERLLQVLQEAKADTQYIKFLHLQQNRNPNRGDVRGLAMRVSGSPRILHEISEMQHYYSLWRKQDIYEHFSREVTAEVDKMRSTNIGAELLGRLVQQNSFSKRQNRITSVSFPDSREAELLDWIQTNTNFKGYVTVSKGRILGAVEGELPSSTQIHVTFDPLMVECVVSCNSPPTK